MEGLRTAQRSLKIAEHALGVVSCYTHWNLSGLSLPTKAREIRPSSAKIRNLMITISFRQFWLADPAEWSSNTGYSIVLETGSNVSDSFIYPRHMYEYS